MADASKPEYPTSAQIAQNQAAVRQAVTDALSKINAKIRCIELAAQFKSDDPVALAEKIYSFISG